MDYKLIKENFERATENLMRGMPDDDSDFKADYTDLKFEEGSVESHILEAVKMVMKAQNSNEIIASLKAALDTLANNQGYLDIGTDDEPEEADYDTETGEFIGEKLNFKRKKKEEPAPEPKGELIGEFTSMDQSVAKKQAFSNAKKNGHEEVLNSGQYREELVQNPETMKYTHRIFKI